MNETIESLARKLVPFLRQYLVSVETYPLGADASTAYLAGRNLLVAGHAALGTHPTYGASYSAFWRNGSDYSMLTEGTNTFINAPSGSGTVYLRRGNTDLLTLADGAIGTFESFQFGRNFGNGDAYIRTNANGSGNTFLALTGGSYQSIFSTSDASSGAQIVLHGNNGIFGYGILELHAGQAGSLGEIRFTSGGTVRGKLNKVGEWGFGGDPFGNHRVHITGQGTGTGTYPLVVVNSAGTNLLYVRDDGNYNFIKTAWTISSSAETKKFISHVAAADARAVLARQKPRRYQRKGKKNARWEFGMIFEDVLESDPQLAHRDETTGEGGVIYNDYIPLLIADNNAQEQRIAALEAQVAAQDTVIATLSARLTALEHQQFIA